MLCLVDFSGSITVTHHVFPDHDPKFSRATLQTARLLALLAVDPAAEEAIRHGRWRPFLAASLASDDCKLSSHAARAHLNLLSARAARPGNADPQL